MKLTDVTNEKLVMINTEFNSKEECIDALCERLAQAGKIKNIDDFKQAVRVENGLYVVTEGTNAWLSAKVIQSVDLGTHTLFLADVEDGAVLSETPSTTYAYYQSNIKPKPQQTKKTGWRCRICGYIYEGEELPADFVCPICKHGAADFEKI